MIRPTIAIVGASRSRNKFGNKAVRAYVAQGYEVFPIHPKEAFIEGLKAYASLADIPVARLDRVSFYVPPEIGLKILPQITAKPTGEVWLNPGSESPELLSYGRALGLNLVQGCSIVDLGVSPQDFP
jgi:predicted CoA-binding protein